MVQQIENMIRKMMKMIIGGANAAKRFETLRIIETTSSVEVFLIGIGIDITFIFHKKGKISPLKMHIPTSKSESEKLLSLKDANGKAM